MELGALEPIAIGEEDWRAFDITKDCDGITADSTAWSCSLIENQPSGIDPSPSDRVLSSSIVTTVTQIVGDTNITKTSTGVFTRALLGGFPTSAIGKTYRLAALTTLADGRIVKASGTIKVIP